jgi:hypothetical protein
MFIAFNSFKLDLDYAYFGVLETLETFDFIDLWLWVVLRFLALAFLGGLLNLYGGASMSYSCMTDSLMRASGDLCLVLRTLSFGLYLVAQGPSGFLS